MNLMSFEVLLGKLWKEPFSADVPPDGLNYGQANVLVVRVHNSTANGGIWRPVLGHSLTASQIATDRN